MTQNYLYGRRKYAKPQALLWTDDYELDSGNLVPVGTEYEDFIVLSDHNRKEITVGSDRIEKRGRMINGTMRSYHVADKEKYDISWEMLPSRAYEVNPVFDANGKPTVSTTSHTVDGGAGGWDLNEWHNNHPGPFWMLMSYDGGAAYGNRTVYTRAVHVYFSDFQYVINKRGIVDFWDVTANLEEV